MASPSPPFHLTSSQTALAFILPTKSHAEINSLRRIHDKAFRKWDPHINVLYPFVEPANLPAAVAILHDILAEKQDVVIRGKIEEVGSFTHRKNATVFLKPNLELEEDFRRLRGLLTDGLGCSPAEGTHDGVYRPHLTVGQAGLNGDALERLKDQVRKLPPLGVRVASLAVLKRELSGKMRVIEELPFGVMEQDIGDHGEIENGKDDTLWRPCYSLSSNGGWDLSHGALSGQNGCQIQVSVSTYNIMADPLARPFSERLPLITESLLPVASNCSSMLRVLCLQEVNDESLPLLLADPFIQKFYPFSTHSSSTLLPSRRNLVTFASEHFVHFTLPFSELHKSALSIHFPSFPIAVWNVHLSSGLNDQSVLSKKAQMEALTKFTLGSKELDGRQILVVGDFNLTTSSRTIETALSKEIISTETASIIPKVIDEDLWEDAFTITSQTNEHENEWFPGEDGATFDRTTNPIAMASRSSFDKPIDFSPQRYDRILLRKAGYLQTQTFEIFGLPNEDGECGSDHYGVCATFDIGEVGDMTNSRQATEVTKIMKKIEFVDDSTDLDPIIATYLPTGNDRKQREDAVQLLKKTLSGDPSIGELLLGFLGSYFMDTYFSNSDIDIMVFGSASPTTFFDQATAKLREINSTSLTGENLVKEVHFVNSLVPIIEAEILGIKFDLQYCQAPELLDNYSFTHPRPSLSEFVFESSVASRLSAASLRSLNTCRESAYILKTIPDIDSYRMAHRFLSLYFKRRGLYSAKFGYLGGIHLTLMLNRVVKLLSSTTSQTTDPNSTEKGNPPSPASIIRTFLTYYSTFDWAEEIVADPFTTTRLPRSSREPVFIQAIHTPTARPNVAASCTRLSSQTFSTEFALANQKLSEGDWEWCLRPKEAVIDEFMHGYGAFVRVSMDVWDVDEIGGDKVREMIGSLESRVTRLLVNLGRVDGIDARAWPARFCTPASEEVGESTQYKGYYLVGVSAKAENDSHRKTLLSGKVITTVREFERIVLDAKEFQNGNVWISMEVVPKKKVLEMGLVLDERNWSKEVLKALLENEEIGDDDEEDDPAPALEMTAALPNRATPAKKSGTTSLRPAQDIIARIKWDPQLDPEDFLIGYEDRFVGVKETDLGKWKSEQTDEEFIPMHRIVWVRRKGGDGEKVWDRRKKVDLIFGSGKGTGG